MNLRFCVLAWLLLSAGDLAHSREPGWIQTGNLNTARTYGTATLLPNGKVLVIGGYGGSCDLASTELFNPATGTFSPAAAMPQGRSNHTATLLRNGKVLVAGGQCNGVTLADAELYDPRTNSWTPTGRLNIARAYQEPTLLNDGCVLVTGGVRSGTPPVFAQGAPRGSALELAEIYDPSTGKWSTTGSMRTARYYHTATLLSNGDVLVTGGIGSRLNESENSGPPCNVPAEASAEIYHPKTGKWSEVAPLPHALFAHSATLLPNGTVLVAGGQSNGACFASAEIFDPSKNFWEGTGSLPITLSAHTATLMPDGRVLVTGGTYYEGIRRECEIYDPSTGTWAAGPQLNTPHGIHTATLLKDGTLLVMGGVYALGLPGYNQISAELYAVTEKRAPSGPAVEAQPAALPVLPGVD